MQIRIGRGYKDWARAISPTNIAMGKLAQQRVDNLVSAQNARHEVAIGVDGTDCYVFIKQRAGLTCTCQTQTVIDSTHTILDILNSHTHNDPTNAPQNVANEAPLRNGDNKYRVFRVQDPDILGTIDAQENSNFNNYANTKKTLKDVAKLKSERVYIKQCDRQDEELERERLEALDNILDMAEVANDDPTIDPQNAALQRQEGLSHLFGGEGTQCGICFGNGYVNGYSLYGGTRIILETQTAILTNAVIEADNSPAKFALSSASNSIVSWNVVLPTYFMSVPSIIVRDNLKFALNYIIEIKTSDSMVFVPLTTPYLLTRQGMNNMAVIRVRCASSGVGQILRFTHVELNIMLTTLPKVNWSTLEKNIDFQNYDVLQTLSGIEITSKIPNLDRECVIVETKYNSAWHVTSVETKLTAHKESFNTTLSIRLIQNYEQKYALNSIRGVSNEIPFAGIQQRYEREGYQKD